MSEIRLKLLEGDLPHPAFLTDANILNKIPKDKILDFLQMVKSRRINVEAYSDQRWEEIAKQFELKDASEAFSAVRIVDILFLNANTMEEEELREDLGKLGFEGEKRETLITQLKRIWIESESFLTKNRLEAIPTIDSLRWRIDIRVGSNNYLPRKDVLAILRIGTSDGEENNHVHVELDENQLSWVEANIKKIKQELLKAKASIEGKDN